MTPFLTLLKSATSRAPGFDPARWATLERPGRLEVPAEVRGLYELSDGALFTGAVRLWAWADVEEKSAAGLGALRGAAVWLLGTKRETGFFFAAQAGPLLKALPANPRTQWLRTVDKATFVYGLWRAEDDVFVVRSLNELLSLSVPRAGEDFGEVTYVRAMSAVKEALSALEPAKKKKKPAPTVKAAAGSKPSPNKKR